MNIILCVTIGVGFFLIAGCSEDTYTPPDPNEHENRSLPKYPIGIDTVATWANGRYQIVVDAFYDEESMYDKCVMRLVRCYMEDDSHIYILGENEFAVINKQTLIMDKYNIGCVPSEYKEAFEAIINNTKSERVHRIDVIN